MPFCVPPSLTAVIVRCLTKEVKDRFQRASEVRSTLETIQSAVILSELRREEPTGPRTLVLRGIQHLDVKNGDVLLLVGTTKGAFLLRSRREREHWQVAGPYFHGQAVYSLAYDGRNGRHRLWASTGSLLWGTYLRSSDDFGKTWTNPLEANIRFPPESGLSLKNIWNASLLNGVSAQFDGKRILVNFRRDRLSRHQVPRTNNSTAMEDQLRIDGSTL